MNGLRRILVIYLKLRKEVELSRFCTEKSYGLLAMDTALELTPDDEEALKRVLSQEMSEKDVTGAIAVLEEQTSNDRTSVSEVMSRTSDSPQTDSHLL